MAAMHTPIECTRRTIKAGLLNTHAMPCHNTPYHIISCVSASCLAPLLCCYLLLAARAKSRQQPVLCPRDTWRMLCLMRAHARAFVCVGERTDVYVCVGVIFSDTLSLSSVSVSPSLYVYVCVCVVHVHACVCAVCVNVCVSMCVSFYLSVCLPAHVSVSHSHTNAYKRGADRKRRSTRAHASRLSADRVSCGGAR